MRPFVLALLVAAASFARAEVVHVVLCTAEGTCRGAVEKDLSSPFDHGWLWSGTCAVRRIVPGTPVKMPCTNRSVGPFGVESFEADEHVHVLVAPAEMWREVDESLLPSFELPKKKAVLRVAVVPHAQWRARAVSENRGSWWCSAPAAENGCRVSLLAAAERETTILDAHGAAVPDASVSIVEAANGRRHPDVLGTIRGSDRGRVTLRRVPDTEVLSLVVSAPAASPAVVQTRPSDLPSQVHLAPGRRLQGRLLTKREGHAAVPVQDANVSFESWLEGVPVMFRRGEKTKTDGKFSLASLPAVAGMLTIRATGFGTVRREVVLSNEDVSAGDILLIAEAGVRVRLLDDLGRPVGNGRVDAAAQTVTTDAKGLAWLSGITGEEAVTLKIESVCCLTRSVTVSAPLPKIIEVTIQRAFLVTATVVRDGQPVDRGDVIVHSTGRDTLSQIGNDGRIALTIQPREAVDIEIATPSSVPYRTHVEPGPAGERRDLGRIELSDGIHIHGVVVSRVDGSPVEGARVWAPRPIAEGALVAWMRGQVVTGTTATNGSFDLRGFGTPPLTLRVDAPGAAREFVNVSCETTICDLGTVSVGTGATVEVRAAHSVSGDTARLDVRGEGLDFDEIVQTVEDGATRFHNVPRGEAHLRVFRGRMVVCARDIEVGGDGNSEKADCDPQTVHLSGTVTAAGRPLADGTLVWTSASNAPLHGAIMTRASPEGLRQQQSYGVASSSITVSVANGAFSTDDVSAGRWIVAWDSGGGAAERQVDVPDVTSYSVALDFPATAVRGHVKDARGAPVRRAVVQDLEDRSLALADDAGAFRVMLSPGKHHLRAEAGGQRSPTVSVDVGKPDESAPEVELQLGAEAHATIDVTLDGSPMAGAFILAEASSGTTTVLVADAAGEVALDWNDDVPEQVRFAVHGASRWYFGEWHPSGSLRKRTTIDVKGDIGSLIVTSEDHHQRVSTPIVEPHGWDVTRALMLLGIPPRLPLAIDGLPVGIYRTGAQTAAIESGKRTTLALR